MYRRRRYKVSLLEVSNLLWETKGNVQYSNSVVRLGERGMLEGIEYEFQL